MKKLAVIAFAALVAFSACSKVESEPRPAEKVTFAVGTYAANTKGASLSTDGINSFRSMGYLYALDGNAVSTTAQSFFGAEGETISYNSTTNEWLPSHNYYWPKSNRSYVNFVSWYDKNEEGKTDATGKPVVSETSFTISNRTIVADDAILIADEAWRFQGNTTNASQYEGDTILSGVPTLFHHLLSRVEIKIHATTIVDPDNANNTYVVVLQSATLRGMYNTGNLDLVNADPETASTLVPWNSRVAANQTLRWAPNTESSETSTIVSSNTTLTTEYTTILAERSFMPQRLPDAAVLNLVFTVTSKSNDTVTSSECDIPASLVINTVLNSNNQRIDMWLPNTIYTYSIAINPISQAILLNPTVETDWTNGQSLSAVVE